MLSIILALLAGILLGGLAVLIILNIAAAAHRKPPRRRYTENELAYLIQCIHDGSVT